MNQDWKKDPKLNHMDPAKLQLLQSLAEQGNGKNMSDMLKGEGFKITFNSDRDITVKADHTMINRSFYNLLANAVNYSDSSREIIVNQIIKKNYVLNVKYMLQYMLSLPQCR